METKKANATNNFIIRIWSKKYYNAKLNQHSNIYRGTITDVKSKEVQHFHSPGEFLLRIEKMFKSAEKKK